jgi:hypothetical protein
MQTEFPFNETPKTELSLGDLQATINLIDICSKRGAFSGEELSSVGALRDKIKTFLTENTPKKEPDPIIETEPARD